MKKCLGILSLLILVLGNPAHSQTPVPLGTEFQVNSYTSDGQTRQAVAVDAQGNFVVTWQSEGSYGSDTSGWGIQAQLFDGSGEPVGSEFQVNSYTTGPDWSPSVAADHQGKIVVVWNSMGSHGTDTSGTSIVGQQYSVAIFINSFESADTSAWSSTVE